MITPGLPFQSYAGSVAGPLLALMAIGMTPSVRRVMGDSGFQFAPTYMTLADLESLRTLEEYATFQSNVHARLKDINTEFGVKPLTPESQTEWASLDELDKELNARIAEATARRDRIAAIDADRQGEQSFRPAAPRAAQKARRVPEDVFALEQYRNLASSETELLQAYRDGAMFAVEHARYPNPQSKPDQDQARIAHLLDEADLPTPHNPQRALARRILATGSPLYMQAFTKKVMGKPTTPSEEQALAAWSVQTDATGGYAVPFSFDPTLLHVGAWTAINPYRRACTVKTIVGTDTYHGVTAAAVTATRAAEAAAVAEGGPAVGQISAIVGKVHAMVSASMELLQDRPDIVSELASLISEAKDTEEESIFTLGVGDALGQGFNPIGMSCATTTAGGFTEVETASNNAFAIADLYAVEAALPIRHRMNAAWFLGRATIRAAQAMETAGGQLFGGQNYASVGYPQVDPFGNTGLRLLNYPIWEAPSTPTGVVDSTIIGALCNPSQFYIIERAGMSVEIVQQRVDGNGFPTGQRGVYAWWRNTAKPASVDAGRRIRVNPA